MEVTYKKIPDQFRTNIPKGMRLLQRPEAEVLLVESLFCPKGHSLLVDSVRIHDEPSIKLNIEIRGQKGIVFLDSIWGSHANLFTTQPQGVGPDDEVKAFCPYCNAPLNLPQTCARPDCTTTTQIQLFLPGGRNHILICPQLTCPHHELIVEELPEPILEMIDEINYFGAGQEDIFGGI